MTDFFAVDQNLSTNLPNLAERTSEDFCYKCVQPVSCSITKKCVQPFRSDGNSEDF